MPKTIDPFADTAQTGGESPKKKSKKIIASVNDCNEDRREAGIERVLSPVRNFCGGLATIDATEDWSELLESNTKELN